MGRLDHTIWPKVAVGIAVLGLLLHLIAFGSDYWARTDPTYSSRNEHIGLWKYCAQATNNGNERCDDFININYAAFIMASEAFMTLALFTYLGMIALLGMYAFTQTWEGEKEPLGGCLAASLTTTLFIVITVAVMGGCHPIYFASRETALVEGVSMVGWSLYVALASLICSFICATLFGIELSFVIKEEFLPK